MSGLPFDQTSPQAIDIEGQQADAVAVDAQQAGMQHRPRAAIGRGCIGAGSAEGTLGEGGKIGGGDAMAGHAAILAQAFTRAIFGS